METDDIAEWLTAIWDVDAGAAEGNGTVAWLTFREPDGSMRYTAVASGEPDDHWVVDGEERTDYASANVVLDERQVLARIARDRKILKLHEPYRASWGADVCSACAGGAGDGADWPCETVRLLAETEAHRPGYNEQWRP